MATSRNAPLTGEMWQLSIDGLLEPLPQAPRLGGPGPFVINLSASSAPIGAPAKRLAEFAATAHVYQIQRTEDRRPRYRLRLGPFLTEEEADALLAGVREIYPSALTATAESDDLRAISSLQAKAEASATGRHPKRTAVPAAAGAPAAAAAPAVPPACGAPPAASANRSPPPQRGAISAPPTAGSAPTAPLVAPQLPQPLAIPVLSDTVSVVRRPPVRATAVRAAVPAATHAAKPVPIITHKVIPTVTHKAAPPAGGAAGAQPSAVRPAPQGPTPASRQPTPSPPSARRVEALSQPLPNLESTQTLRPLTQLELEDTSVVRWFAIQLSVAEQGFNPDSLPNLDIFAEYRLYSVLGTDRGKVMHALRLGFFAAEDAAAAVASYLSAFYEKPTVKRISAAERERFNEQRVEARMDVGATGKHAVIEITSERVVREKRTTATITPMPVRPAGTADTRRN